MRITTKTGDDGTTGLFYGGRVAKDSGRPEAYGAVDEAQAAIGLARAEAVEGSELAAILLAVGRDLYVVMAELATLPENRSKLTPGASSVTAEMVDALETEMGHYADRFEPPTEFVVPGGNRGGALLDVARTVVRRAERRSIAVAGDGSHVVPYLNRLSDLLWTLARWVDQDTSQLSRTTRGVAEK